MKPIFSFIFILLAITGCSTFSQRDQPVSASQENQPSPKVIPRLDRGEHLHSLFLKGRDEELIDALNPQLNLDEEEKYLWLASLNRLGRFEQSYVSCLDFFRPSSSGQSNELSPAIILECFVASLRVRKFEQASILQKKLSSSPDGFTALMNLGLTIEFCRYHNRVDRLQEDSLLESFRSFSFCIHKIPRYYCDIASEPDVQVQRHFKTFLKRIHLGSPFHPVSAVLKAKQIKSWEQLSHRTPCAITLPYGDTSDKK